MRVTSFSTAAFLLLLTSGGLAFGQAGTAPAPSTVPAPAVTDGMPAIPGAQPNSQAYPAKYSGQNAALDGVPIMARPIPLSDAQKRRIVETVLQDRKAVETINAAPAQFLPYWVTPQALPNGLVTEIPILDHLKYVRIPNKILLVAPANNIVVGEISAQ